MFVAPGLIDRLVRSMRLAGLLGAAAVLLVAGPEALAAQSAHPNILFVVSDDLNTDIGPYVESSLGLHTPNLDRIAAEGMTFTRAYAQFPVCGPSRASFLSGLYPETNGVTGNGFASANHRLASPALADHPALGGFLRARGYYTARVSKIFHMGVPGGIERGEVGSDDPDSWDYALNVMAPETLSPGFLEKLSAGDHYGSNFSRMILADGAEASQADVLATDQAIAILENRTRPKPPNATNRTKLKEEAPFFLAVGFVRPHVPLIAPERHFARYPDAAVELPHVPIDDLEDVPEAAQRTANAGRFRMDAEQQRKAIAAYYASISFMDEQLGRLLDALDRLGLTENTVVVFTSDHGYNLGEHTSWQKTSLWEESVRVPLIISVPGMRTAGTRTDEIVELIDLYPTIAELSGLSAETPSILQGESLVDRLNGLAPSDPDGSAYTITGGSGASLRTDRWRYNRWGEAAEGDNEELYDHENDPMEHENLARDPTYHSILDSIRAEFEQTRSQARSASAVPERDLGIHPTGSERGSGTGQYSDRAQYQVARDQSRRSRSGDLKEQAVEHSRKGEGERDPHHRADCRHDATLGQELLDDLSSTSCMIPYP
jgi:arylsulfatase A-like enzyme